MNPYTLPALVAATLNLVLVIWVYVKTAPGLIRRTFICWNLEMAFWSASIAIGYSLPNAETAMAWYKATIPIAISLWLPAFYILLLRSRVRIVSGIPGFSLSLTQAVPGLPSWGVQVPC